MSGAHLSEIHTNFQLVSKFSFVFISFLILCAEFNLYRMYFSNQTNQYLQYFVINRKYIFSFTVFAPIFFGLNKKTKKNRNVQFRRHNILKVFIANCVESKLIRIYIFNFFFYHILSFLSAVGLVSLLYSLYRTKFENQFLKVQRSSTESNGVKVTKW